MLSNSLAAGALATCYVLLVAWQLNPELRLDPADLLPLARTIGPYYALHLTTLCYALLVGRQLLARQLFSPAWMSVGVQSWLGVLTAAAGAALTWANLRTFALVLPPEVVQTMIASATTLAACAVALLLIALWHRRAGRRGRWVRAAMVATVALASVAVPMAVRGEGRLVDDPRPLALPMDESTEPPAAERTARVRVIAIDAASLEFITNAAAEGRLPNFGRLLDAGAVMDLATLRPTSAEAVWTAVATGMLPQKNGIRSAAVYRLPGGQAIRLLPDFTFASGLVRFGFLTEEAHTSASVQTRPIWSLLGTHGVTVGLVNWPLTYPAPFVRGFVVSDLHVRLALTPFGLDDPLLVYPARLRDGTLPIIQESADLPDVPPPVFGAVFEERHRVPARIDRIHGRLAETTWTAEPPQVTLVRYESLDPIGHAFLRYALPSRFGNVTEDERRRYGAVLESHYGIIDEAIGRALNGLEPGDLLLVVSGYGMEPLGPGKRLIEQLIGDPEVSGTHEDAPDGFLMAYGSNVEPRRHLTRASIVDVVPTVLYYLGLPVGRDMDGYARPALFRQAFTDARPITYIPSYEP